MSNINNIIPTQNFEIIRDKIATILETEFAQQFALTSNALFQAGVWKERFITFDKTELPAVRVYFTNSSYDSHSPDMYSGDAYFNIEVHTSAKFTSTTRGDVKATEDCNKLLGIIRYIFAHPAYIRLDFSDLTIIRWTSIEGINIGQPTEKDGIQSITGVLNFKVKYNENSGALTSSEMTGADSNIEFTQLEINN